MQRKRTAFIEEAETLDIFENKLVKSDRESSSDKSESSCNEE